MATTIQPPFDAALPSEAPGDQPVDRSRPDVVVSIAFVGALLIPIVAWLLGVTPESLEARDATPMPVVDLVSAGDPATFAELDRFLSDAFPFRSAAVRAHAQIDYGLLGGSTNPEIIVGRDGWLFGSIERDAICRLSVDEAMASLDAAHAAAAKAGIELRYIVPPDKHAIMSDHVVPGSGLGEACTDRGRPALRDGLRQRSGYAIDLWDDLTAARSTESERPVYFAQDTHWTPFGAAIAIRRLVESIDPSVWTADELRVDGEAAYPMDLSRLMGLPRTESMGQLRVRPDVTPTVTTIETDVALRNARAIPWYHVDPAVRAIDGRTLVVYDSFFGTSEERIAPWFRESVWVHYNDLLYHPELVDDLPPFDGIVLERAERHAHSIDAMDLLAPLLRMADCAGARCRVPSALGPPVNDQTTRRVAG